MDIMTEKIELQTASQPKTRNAAIECCRLIASFFVVFIHCGFPGKFGEIMNCLARFAVPFFFVVSGYFMYHVDDTVIKKRAIGIAKLNVYSTLLYLLWGSYKEKYIFERGRMPWLMAVFSKQNLSRWFVNGKNPVSGHLWYLCAIFVCYIIIYIYVRWCKKAYNYYSLYIVGVILYAVHIMMDSMTTAADFGMPSEICRNALFFGIPMISLGIFIREYQERIIETYQLSRKRLILIVAFGAGLSLFQSLGTGKVEMPIGALLEVIALMLLFVTFPPKISNNKVLSAIISKLGELSTYIYISHMIWGDICGRHNEVLLSILGETTEAYIRPILIVLVSVITGVIWIVIKDTGKKCFRQISSGIGQESR